MHDLWMQCYVQEMTALCVLLVNGVSFPVHYMEAAVTTYSGLNRSFVFCTHNLHCRLLNRKNFRPLYATRATFLVTELLIAQNTTSSFSEAAAQCIRMSATVSFDFILIELKHCFDSAKFAG